MLKNDITNNQNQELGFKSWFRIERKVVTLIESMLNLSNIRDTSASLQEFRQTVGYNYIA